jgi:hypothetical protein
MYDYRADLTRLRDYWHAYSLLLYVCCLVYKACTDLILGLFVTPVHYFSSTYITGIAESVVHYDTGATVAVRIHGRSPS